MISQSTLLLKRSDVSKLISLEECMDAVENAFRIYAEGKASPPGILGIHVPDGGFHIKAGVMDYGGNFFVAKTNANFPANKQRFQLPTIQGVIVVSDADKGSLLCVMDSIEITILRTGAATAVAAKYLSRQDSSVATIWGCGNQGKISARMLAKIRDLEIIYLYDVNRTTADQLASELRPQLGIDVLVVNEPLQAIAVSDIIITCTTSKEALFGRNHVRPGTFIAAVGADSDSKQELEPSLFGSSKVVVDLLDQAATIGDLHHALDQKVISRDGVFAELGEIICGAKKGRESEEEIIVFDSTGMALQDVAAASTVFKKATERHIGYQLSFND